MSQILKNHKAEKHTFVDFNATHDELKRDIGASIVLSHMKNKLDEKVLELDNAQRNGTNQTGINKLTIERQYASEIVDELLNIRGMI